MEEDRVVLCQALYQSIGEEEWTEMHERKKEVFRNIGVKKAGQIIAGLGKVAWRKTGRNLFFSAKNDLEAAFNRRSVLRESLQEVWKRGHTRHTAYL